MAAPLNILFLLSDQHAQSVSGAYGDSIVRTPHLDALAARGAVFDNGYCASPICLPSRMSLLTAQEPHRQQCWTNQDILPSGIPTMAHALGAAGYRTALIGRMHSIGPDQWRGYAHREVGDHSTNWIGGRTHDLGVLDKANDPYRESLRNSGAGGCAYEIYDRTVTEAAVAHLERLGRERDPRPFAMTVGWILPHAPYVCAPELYDHYAGRVAPPHIPVPSNEHPHYAWWRHDRGIADATNAEIMRARAAYYGAVETLDGMLGQVLAALEASGFADNTAIVYASDHGEHLGNRGLWWKSTLYDESAKVPLVISLPPAHGVGGRRRQVCGLIDVTATILDLAGAPPLPASQGRSLLPVLGDAAAPWLDQAFSEYVNDGVPAWSGGRVTVARMIRRGRWKLIYHLGQPPQLFDLASDPTEQRDLAGRADHAAIERTLTEQVLAGWDPAAIAALQVQRAEEHALLGAWARAVQPPDLIRWTMQGGQNWLRDETADAAGAS